LVEEVTSVPEAQDEQRRALLDQLERGEISVQAACKGLER
jgi:hypothetical protein